MRLPGCRALFEEVLQLLNERGAKIETLGLS